MRILGFIITILSILILPTSAFCKENWTRVHSANFIIVGNASENDMKKLADKMEQFRQSIQIVLPKLNLTDSVPTTIYLFKDDSSFHPFKPIYKGKIRDNVGGYFFPTQTMNYIALSADKERISPFAVIFHEFFHFVIKNNLDVVPPWLNEGLAEYYSTFEVLDQDKKIKLGAPITQRIAELRNKPLLPLETLLDVDNNSPYYNEDGKAGIFYAESWALVHYLILGNNSKRLSQLSQFINQANTGLSVADNFRQSFQTDYKGMEEELRKYISNFSLPVLSIKLLKQIDYAKDLQSETLSEAETQYLMGDLMLQSDRSKEAEDHFKKALGFDPKHSASQLSLGILCLRQDRQDESEKYITAALASDAKNGQAYLFYATFLHKEKHIPEAVKAIQQAILYQPNMVPAYIELGYLNLEVGDGSKAVEAFNQALKLNPHDTDLLNRISFAFLEYRLGKPAADYAVAFLKRKHWHDQASLYMALTCHFGFRESQNTVNAGKILTEAEQHADTSAWPFPVIKYLKGSLSERDLLVLATDNDKLTEAHAYLGLDLILNGKRDEALSHFNWVTEHGNKKFYEYALTLAELARINSSH